MVPWRGLGEGARFYEGQGAGQEGCPVQWRIGAGAGKTQAAMEGVMGAGEVQSALNATRWGWGGQKELSSVKGKEWGQEGRMVLWRVGAGAGEGPHGTRAAMRCLRQWVSSSPAEHKSGPRRGLPSSPPPLSVCVCEGVPAPPSLGAIAWVPIPALTHPHHPGVARLSAALARLRLSSPGTGRAGAGRAVVGAGPVAQ